MTFTIDATPPVSKAVVDADARTVTLSAADSGAGLAASSTALAARESGRRTRIRLTVGDEETTVEFRAIDKLGNVEAANTSVVPAKGKPLAATVTAFTLSSTSVKVGDKVTATVRVKGNQRHPDRRGVDPVRLDADRVRGARQRAGDPQPQGGQHRRRHQDARRPVCR